MMKQDEIDWDKPFPITSVCRADLKGILSDKEIGALTDAEMAEIAEQMAEAYVEQGFREQLACYATRVKDDREPGAG